MTREIEHALDAGGWMFVDNSGDGGPFGFHMKPLFGGKYVLGLSTGGKGTDNDYLYPVTLDGWADPKMDLMVAVWQAKEGTILPITLYDFLAEDRDQLPNEVHKAICSAMKTVQAIYSASKPDGSYIHNEAVPEEVRKVLQAINGLLDEATWWGVKGCPWADNSSGPLWQLAHRLDNE